MKALTASEIIRLWETGHRLHPIDQALSMLGRAIPEYSRDELATLPLGQRNILLLGLRRMTFGDRLPGKDHCPRCGESVEFELSCRALMHDAASPRLQRREQSDYSFEVRPLNSFDVAAAAVEPTTGQARQCLLRRCVAEAHYQGKPIAAHALPPELEQLISETASAADPAAEMLLDLDCPACRHPWQGLLDIVHILWFEIGARAQRLLMEVHLLARAYGWTETEILKLSAARRASYLKMVAI